MKNSKEQFATHTDIIYDAKYVFDAHGARF